MSHGRGETIILGRNDDQEIGFDLNLVLKSRLLIAASSGAGKSETLRRICAGAIAKLPIIIIDPEGEYAPLRSQFPFALIGPGGEGATTLETAELTAHTLLETGASAIIDLFEMGRQKHEYAKRFFEALDTAPKHLWRELLLIVDEAHIFAPERGETPSVASDAFADLASRGRKRGYGIVPATQRLAKLNNDVAALCENVLIGRTGQIDQDRAARALNIADRAGKNAFAREIGQVADGEFYAWGRAFGLKEPTLFQVERVPGAALAKAGKVGRRSAPPTPDAIRALMPKFAELPQMAEQKVQTEEALRRDLAAAQKRIRELERTAPKAIAVTTTKAAPEAQIDKETLRMLAKKLDALSQGVSEAAKLAEEDEERRTRAIALLAELQKLLAPSTAVSKVLRKATETKDAARALLPAESAETTAPARQLEKPARSTPPAAEANRDLDGPEARILDNVAWLVSSGIDDPESELIAFLSGYSTSTSTSFKNPRSRLKERGLVTYPSPGRIRLTDEGSTKASGRDVPISLDELHEAIFAQLPGPEEKMLRLVLAAYPGSMTSEALAAGTGYSIATSTSFKNPRSRLKSLGFVEYPTAGVVRATTLLFPGALA